MKNYLAFLKKEQMENLRTGHITFTAIIFVLFGIMNPAIAKLTPWMMEQLSGELAKSGMTVQKVTVDAMTSWQQFYKNIPIALIVFVLIYSSIMTNEYQKGTILLVLTKRISRLGVLCAKGTNLLILWTGSYWGCYLITYVYNAYFWDNSIAKSCGFAAAMYYLFGIWVISLVMLGSALFDSTAKVMLFAGGGYIAVYILSIVNKLKLYMPVYITNGMSIIQGEIKPEDCIRGIVVTVLLIVVNSVLAAIAFNKRKL